MLRRQVYLGVRVSTRTLATKPKILDISTKLITNDDVIKHNDEKFITHPLFPHPIFTDKDCQSVKVEHREPRTFSDKVAYNTIRMVRSTFDLVTRYDSTGKNMNEKKWLTRVIFLESVAGVPGAVASFLRHLHSIRLLKRDKAWVETLLDEAYNERMHLLTFIKIGKPSWFTRVFIYLGQGVFTNGFFFLYLANPKICHRLVGYLEEEAVATYTHLIKELEEDKLPQFNNMKIPNIAWQYWTELDENSSFLDLIQRIRADESKHREVNHTLANLDQKDDRNPFALKVGDKVQPENGLEITRGTGWERKDLEL